MEHTIKKLDGGKVEFKVVTDEVDFRTKPEDRTDPKAEGAVIGKAHSVNVVVIDKYEDALSHITGELDFVNSELEKIDELLEKTNFDEEKFTSLCEDLNKGGGRTTVAKYKKLDNLMEVYNNVQNLKKNRELMLAEKEKIEEQHEKVSTL